MITENSPKTTFDVRAFGAAGDGVTMDTAAIRAAIDACTGAGGGTVLFCAGKFLTGTLFLKNNVTLYLENTATILGSKSLSDYSTEVKRCGFVNEPHIDKCLIYAGNVENVAIVGQGTIDGQGAAFRGSVEQTAGGEGYRGHYHQ
jgi:polygalacturonase